MIPLDSLHDDRFWAIKQNCAPTFRLIPFIQKGFLIGLLLFLTLARTEAGGTISTTYTSKPGASYAGLLVTDPIITVRCANPQYNCTTEKYCLDVEFQSNQANKELFGMNVRFLYDDTVLEFVNFTGYVGGYGAIAPNPPAISLLSNGVPWGFAGSGDYVNGAIQKVNTNAPPIYISTSGWTKLFQICFTVDNGGDENNFCPPFVWDLEQNPANGGYPPGSAGVVMTLTGAAPAIEAVDHFNWQYVGSGGQPYGEPIEETCSSIVCGTCSLIVTSTADAGANSLRDIISCAAAGDTIGFASTLAGATITISTTKLIISKNLYIRSNLSPRVKINSTIPGLFEIAAGKTVEFKDLEITSGITLADNSGAAFKNLGILRLLDVKVFKNTALGTAQYLVKNFPSSQCFLFGNCFVEIP